MSSNTVGDGLILKMRGFNKYNKYNLVLGSNSNPNS